MNTIQWRMKLELAPQTQVQVGTQEQQLFTIIMS